MSNKLSQISDKLSELNSNLRNIKVTTITYSMTATANQWVSPYTFIGNFTIPDADLAKYGEPISVTAMGFAGEAVPATFEDELKHIRATSSSASVTLRVTFLKLP